MKYLTLFSTILAVASAAPLAEVADVESIQDVQDVQAKDPGAPLDMTAQGVKILPKFVETPTPKDGAKRVTKKIGTWSVSSSKMLSTFKMVSDSPCPSAITGCYVTAMEATIRYPDGKEANVDTGAWLHHIAMFGSGTGSGSIWACGNERPTLRLNSQSKYGISWPATYMMMIDLMTEVTTPKSLTLEITFEVVPMTQAGYKGATMYWLTLGADRDAKDGAYSFDTQTSKVSGPGQLLYSIGHMHDGGTDMQLFVQDGMIGKSGKMVCKSVMHYDAKPAAGGMEGMAGHGHSRRDGHGGHGAPGDHITAPGACTDFGELKAGQYIRATAQYDANKHPLMVHNGKREKLMGNMRVYVGPV